MRHEMLQCLAHSRHHQVGWGYSRCLGRRHNQDLFVIQHQIHQPWAYTSLLASLMALLLRVLDLLEPPKF